MRRIILLLFAASLLGLAACQRNEPVKRIVPQASPHPMMSMPAQAPSPGMMAPSAEASPAEASPGASPSE